MIEQREVHWNHDAEKIQDATGISKEELLMAAMKFHELAQPYKGNWTKSRKYQLLLENFEPLVAIMLMELLTDFENDQKRQQEQLLRMLAGDRCDCH